MVWVDIQDEDKIQVMKRKPGPAGHGTLGRPINLRTNYFQVTIDNYKQVSFYHFDVNIDDKVCDVKEEEAGPVSKVIGAQALPIGMAPPTIKKKGKNRKKGRKQVQELKKDDDEEEEIAKALSEAQLQDEGSTNRTGTEKSRRIPKPKLRKIFLEFIKHNHEIFKDYPMGFDGEKNAYSTAMPPQLKTEFSKDHIFVGEGLPHRKYKVSFKFVSKADLSTLYEAFQKGLPFLETKGKVFQSLEIIFNAGRSAMYDIAGRNKFFSTNNCFGPPFQLMNGKEGKLGFYGSLRPVGWKDGARLMLNVDIAHAAFYKHTSVINFLQENFPEFREQMSSYSFPDYLRRNIFKLLVKTKIKVQTIHIKQYQRPYVVNDVGPETAITSTFEFEGSKISVKDYFQKKHNFSLRYPNLPVLKCGSKLAMIPMEALEIVPGQKVRGKLTGEETAQFIKSTAVPAHERLNDIKHIMKDNKFANDPLLTKTNISINTRPEEVKGRVLPEPTIVTGSRESTRITNGKWMIKHQFKNPGKLENWVLADFTGHMRDSAIWAFIGNLGQQARSRGMGFDNPVEIIVESKFKWTPQAIDRTLVKACKNYNNLSLIICIISDNTSHYKTIKAVGDRQKKVLTQCIKYANVMKNHPATVGNLLLKINGKLGGVSHSASSGILRNITKQPCDVSHLLDCPTIVMGADVNHPAVSDKCSPSYAAVVGSWDLAATQYATEVRHQQHRQEIIEDMTSMTSNLLKRFFRCTRFKPKRIIMYRDGVSESQFTTVLSHELLKMRAACTALEEGYNPSITFFCIQKRHNTRFFPVDRDDAKGKSGNVPAGTIVDHSVTHPTEADFFLCSHEGIQGTSKPCHYRCLWDDSDISEDVRQMLAYMLCHNYGRCSRSVSMPAPAYYAHLAAYRAKVHLDGMLEISSDDTASQTSSGIVEYTSSFLDEAVTFNNDDFGHKAYYL